MYLSTLLILVTGTSAFLSSRQGNSQCAIWCAAHFTKPGPCTSQATKNAGPCYVCGPKAPQPPTQILCSGKCIPIDNHNCGQCGKVCSGGIPCIGGQCVCPSGETDCAGTCTNLQTDNGNCGTCGTTCTSPKTCMSGTCSCPSGENDCSGTCTSLQSDNCHCGTCGTACGGGETCQTGTCVAPPWPTDFGPDTCNNVPSTTAPGQYQARSDGFNCYCLRPGTQPQATLCPTDPNGQAGCTQTCQGSDYDPSPGGGCGFAGSRCYIQCNSCYTNGPGLTTNPCTPV